MNTSELETLIRTILSEQLTTPAQTPVQPQGKGIFQSVSEAIDAAHQAFLRYQQCPLKTRSAIISAIRQELTPLLASLAEEALAKRPGFRSFRCQQSSLLAFEFDGIHHSDLVTLLAESGIALRAGQHCAQPLLAALGVSGTLRASFAPYNTQDDVAALVHAVDRALEILVD